MRRPASTDGERVVVIVDGRPIDVACGTLVSAALEIASPSRGARVSPGGARRQAFCGMGVCGECRVIVDGVAHRLGCQVACVAGMVIERDA